MEQGVTAGYEPKHHLCYCLSNINLNQTIIGSIQKGLYLNCDWLGQHTSQHYAELSTSWLWSRMTLGIGTPEQLCQEAACLHCSLLRLRNGPGSDRRGPLPPFKPLLSPLLPAACMGPCMWDLARAGTCATRLLTEVVLRGKTCYESRQLFTESSAQFSETMAELVGRCLLWKWPLWWPLPRGRTWFYTSSPPRQAGQLPVWKWLFVI